MGISDSGAGRGVWSAGPLRVPYRTRAFLAAAMLAAGFVGAFALLSLNVHFMVHSLPYLLKALPIVLLISVLSAVAAVVLGIIGASCRMARHPIPFGIATYYVSYIQGVPFILNLYLIYFGLPELNSAFLMSPTQAGVTALALTYGAYMSEVFRAGVRAIPRGQSEAALSIGMTRFQVHKRIVSPQALRIIIPAAANLFIFIVKDSAIVSYIGVSELFSRAQEIGLQSFHVPEALILVALIYWILTVVLTMGLRTLERKLAVAHTQR